MPAAEGRPAQQLFASQTDAFVSASRLPQAGVQRAYLNLYEKAKRRGADPGRNILLRGATTGDGHVRSATRTELRRSIRVLKRMTAVAPATSAGAASPQLEAIAACESGGDPATIGGGGLYRGKYQFSYETWQSVGGSGDPAAAPEAEQDARAAALLARDGAGHWPVCGG
ncbi:MAG: transglycosylase family protein [Thermoleophilaceae bacterium]